MLESQIIYRKVMKLYHLKENNSSLEKLKIELWEQYFSAIKKEENQFNIQNSENSQEYFSKIFDK